MSHDHVLQPNAYAFDNGVAAEIRQKEKHVRKTTCVLIATQSRALAGACASMFARKRVNMALVQTHFMFWEFEFRSSCMLRASHLDINGMDQRQYFVILACKDLVMPGHALGNFDL